MERFRTTRPLTGVKSAQTERESQLNAHLAIELGHKDKEMKALEEKVCQLDALILVSRKTLTCDKTSYEVQGAPAEYDRAGNTESG